MTQGAPPSSLRLFGSPGASGMAFGPALVIEQRSLPIPHRQIAADEVAAEVNRLQRAFLKVKSELESIRESLDPQSEAEHRLLIDAHLWMLKDELFFEASLQKIRSGKCAEWALREAGDAIIERIRQASSFYLRERAQDIEHLVLEIVRALRESGCDGVEFEKAAILVTTDLSATQLLALPRHLLLGIVTEEGTSVGHLAIVARALRIPAVVGVKGALQHIANGTPILIDGRKGEVILSPTEYEEGCVHEHPAIRSHSPGPFSKAPFLPTTTRDGHPISIAANIEFASEVREAIAEGAEGVGLFRTEFLYLEGSEPDEEHLVGTFIEAGSLLAPKCLILRTFDLGGDKLPSGDNHLAKRISSILGTRCRHALGMRGTRLAMRLRDLLETQVRAALRAAAEVDIRLMFPMISTLDEWREVKRLVDHVLDALQQDRVPHRKVPLGAMIETPAGIWMAPELSDECDFLSLGTNDLTQYALAWDRHYSSTEPPFLEPSLLRMIAHVAQVVARKGQALCICGDLAFHPLAAPLLVGLGLRSFSVPPSEIHFLRATIARLSLSECEKAAQSALSCTTQSEVKQRALQALKPMLGGLWESMGLVL
ncbi:MAG: phosphoenolpyruvate--protein phosphotransferase [Sandaracinaceae bacterium]|nr:phosphoenolpyruvate--protein phosphotransferase [Sandaracinaceae bacterium]